MKGSSLVLNKTVVWILLSFLLTYYIFVYTVFLSLLYELCINIICKIVDPYSLNVQAFFSCCFIFFFRFKTFPSAIISDAVLF